MILSVVIILLIGGIAYFHFVQGFFSAMLSAICAIFAALLALGYYETVVQTLLGGKMADYAHGMVLIALFALIYTLLRLAFDGFVPGNVRVPLYMDKVGAAVMGLIAGLFATGVLAVAAQLLPFGPSVAGHARFGVDGARQVTVSGLGSRAQDLNTYNELLDEAFDPAKVKKLVVPVDDMLVGVVSKLSGPAGSLSGKRPLDSVHPDLLLESFGQRLGMQAGAKHVAVGAGGTPAVSVGGLYSVQEVAQIQGELEGIKNRNLAKSTKPASKDESLLVVRAKIDPNAADDRDKRFRFSLGSVRLVVGGVNWYPIGTLEDSGVLFSSRPDDFLVMPAGKDTVDLVFRVINSDVMVDPNAKPAELKPGSFIEIKRMGRAELTGQPIKDEAPPRDAKVGLMWKPGVLENKPGTLRIDTSTAPLDVLGAEVSDQLFTAINVGRGDADMTADFTGGKATLVARRFKSFEVDGTVSMLRLGQGEQPVKALMVPAGKRIVQIKAARKGDPWKWADISKYELQDAGGGKYKPIGAWAKVVVGTSNHMVGRFDAERGVNDIPQVDGTPSDIYLAFAVPPGVTLSSLKYEDKPVAALTTQVR